MNDLFELDLDCYTNIILGDDFETESYKIRRSYIESALILAKKCVNSPLTDGYTLIYALLFLFRHYLELELKFYYNNYVPPTNKQNIKLCHYYQDEWLNALEKKFKDLSGNKIPSVLKKYIDIFNILDKKGDFFKYEEDTNGIAFRKMTVKGNEIIYNEPLHIGLINLKKDMEEINDFFLELEHLIEEEKRKG